MTKGTVGVEKAAELLGVSKRTIYNWIYSDKLKASKNHDGEWEIPLEDIRAILDANMKKYDKAIDLATGMEALEEFHATRLLQALEVVAQASRDVADAYDEAKKVVTNERAADVAKSERTNELVSRIMKLDSALQYYKNMAFIGPFLEDMHKEVSRLLRESDENWSRQVAYLKEVRKRAETKERVEQ